MDVVDAVGVGVFGDLRDVVGDFLGLEGVGGIEDADAGIEGGCAGVQSAYTRECLYNPRQLV